MSETELLDLQIRITGVFWLKKIGRYKAVQNDSERLRMKRLRECRRAESQLRTLQYKKSQIGGITSWEENA